MNENVQEPSDSNDVLAIISEKQQIAFNELSDLLTSRGLSGDRLRTSLSDLEARKIIASRSSGGILMYYPLQQQETLRKVLIVEDDKNINKLMALSIGKGFEVSQLYDGGEALPFIRKEKPNLVILDLMLPNKDGLDICQTVKSDPDIRDSVVILVSAMDPTSNRFKGIKYGADYYIKKPFDPSELRSLVTIFLRKRGKRFDPLIDLPDEERISKEIERSIKADAIYSIGTLKVENLGEYVRRFGEKSGMVILRLISQLLQDSIKNTAQNTFVGFLNSDVFVIAGSKESVNMIVNEIKQEFSAVMPFILQDEGYKAIDLNLERLFDSKEVPRLSLLYEETNKDELKKRREQILREKGPLSNEIGAYTYEELQKLFGSDSLDVKITRDSNGVRLQVGKKIEEGER